MARTEISSNIAIQVSEYLPDHCRIFSAIAPGIALPPTCIHPTAAEEFVTMREPWSKEAQRIKLE